MIPIEASKKSNEKEVYQNLQDMKIKQKPRFKLGQLVSYSQYYQSILKRR